MLTGLSAICEVKNMVITKNVTIAGRAFIHTYSDIGRQIQREDGAVFDDAYDVVEHSYTETDRDILVDDDE